MSVFWRLIRLQFHGTSFTVTHADAGRVTTRLDVFECSKSKAEDRCASDQRVPNLLRDEFDRRVWRSRWLRLNPNHPSVE